MKRFILVIAPMLFGFLLFSQSSRNTLLWRISGNGLQQPSYLYGTIHLTDQRLFNFGDSLYHAIASTEGFAMEVSPEEMMPFLIDMVQREIKNNINLRQMMSDSAYKKYAPALSRKLHKPASQITANDVFREKNKWVSESFKKGRMQTFMDTYLFDLARREGKWTGGVEDMQDQAGLINNLVDESDVREIALSDQESTRSGLETMISAYLKSDLGMIEAMENQSDSAFLDAMLVKRNIKMARRMDSLSHIRTMVFAVGAAHLPGKDGVITLLAKRGFTVEPVFSSKRIKAADYKVKDVKVPWVQVRDKDGNYEVEMPGKPGDITMYGIVNMKMYFNIFNGTGYMATAIATPYAEHSIDSLMSVFAENLFHDGKFRNAKDIIINDIPGKELRSHDDDGEKRGYILHKGSTVFFAVGFATNPDSSTTQDLNSFLATFRPLHSEKVVTSTMKVYSDSTLANQIEFPSAPQPATDMQVNHDKSMDSKLLISVDNESGTYFFLGSNATMPGYFLPNDSLLLTTLAEGMKKRLGNFKGGIVYLKDGHRASDIEGDDSNSGLHFQVHYETRGNRWFGLIAMYNLEKKSPLVEQFLSSFKLTDYRVADWKRQLSPDSLFETSAPAPIEYFYPDTSSKKGSYYNVFDSTRSDNYIITTEKLARYYWQNSDSAFWKLILDNNTTKSDTLISWRHVSNGDAQGIELIRQRTGSLNVTRKRVLLFGDSLFSFTTMQPLSVISELRVNAFFEQFRFSRAVPASTIFTSKAAQLLNDLKAPDSATSEQAREALRAAPFTRNDLSILHAALLKKYAADSLTGLFDINEQIGRKIIDLHDSSSLLFAKKEYPLASDPAAQAALLEVVASFKTTENYQQMADMMLTNRPMRSLGWHWENAATDSLELAKLLFPKLLPLLNDTINGGQLYRMVERLADSNMISVEMLRGASAGIVAYAKWRLAVLHSARTITYEVQDHALATVLGLINTPASNQALESLLVTEPNYVKITCIEMLLKNHQPVSAAILSKLAASKDDRISLYRALQRAGKTSLFPAAYLNQSSFAVAVMESGLEDLDISTGTAVLLRSAILPFRGKSARFFFYKIGKSDEQQYLGCAGPYDLNSAHMCVDTATSLADAFNFKNPPGDKDYKALVSKIEAGDN